jgi:hypothetical protein
MEQTNLDTTRSEQVAIMFLEWVQDKKYWRAAKRVGGGWFKIDGNGGTFTTSQLFKIFIKEIDDELLAAAQTERCVQEEEASKNFGGI